MKTWEKFKEAIEKGLDQTHQFNPKTGEWELADPNWESREAQNKIDRAAARAAHQPFSWRTPQPAPSQEEQTEMDARDHLESWIQLVGRNAVKNVMRKSDAEIIEFGEFRGNKEAMTKTMRGTPLSMDPNAAKIIEKMRSLSHLIR